MHVTKNYFHWRRTCTCHLCCRAISMKVRHFWWYPCKITCMVILEQ